MSNFNEWLKHKDPDLLLPLNESTARYSSEVNFRTKMGEHQDNFAKLSLGYVSAAMKNCGFHVKNIYDKKPYRVIISSRNWDNGENVGVVMFKDNSFIIAKGFYNKDKKTVSLTGSHKSEFESAAEIAKEMRNYMEKLKREKPRDSDTLEPAPMKRGPKKMKPTISKFLYKPY